MIRVCVLALICALFCPVAGFAQFLQPIIDPSHASSSATLDEVRVRGNRRSETDAILRLVKSREGTEFNRAQLRSDIKAIFGLGYYSDIEVEWSEVDGRNILTFVVTEKPSVRKVIYSGNSELEEDDLKGVVDIREFSVLDQAKINRNAEKIKDLYIEKGYFLAEVTWRIEEAPDNQADVIFEITEKVKVKISRIEIVGNEAISDEEIHKNIETREGSRVLGVFDNLTGAGTFKAEAFERDIMRIHQFYYDRGYIKAKVGDHKIELSPDRRELILTIPVDEGERFKTVDISGDLLKPKEELMKMVRLKEGEWFSSTDLRNTIEAIGELYKDEGYAYVNIVPNTQVDDENKIVGLTFMIDKGEKVKFGQIKVIGNRTTRDKVIRRELRIYEGEQYSSSQLKRSKTRVTRLGYFETVEFNTSRGIDDGTMDVVIEVKEKPTGAFNAGAGFSSVEGLVGQASISKENLFGRGQSVSLQAQLSKLHAMANLRFADDYLLDTEVRFSTNLYRYQIINPYFTRNSLGGDLTLGYPLTDEWSVAGTYTLEHVSVEEGGYAGRSTMMISNLFSDGLTSSIRGTLYYDSRDNRLFPTSGMFASGSVEWADRLLGSDNEFIRYRLRDRYYHSLGHHMVLKFNADWGLITTSDPDGIPIYERFFVGGPLSVRGFERASLGPALWVPDSSRPDAGTSKYSIGGTEQLFFNAEFEFPIFQEVGVRGVFFADYGNAFERSDAFLDKIGSMRPSWGFGFRWFSPIGPLRFEFGFPFAPKEGEDDSVFEFSIGNFF